MGGKDAALDITVVNSFQVATVVGAATEAGHALTHAFNRKMRGTAEACHRQAVAFMPLVVVREVERLGAALALQSGLLRSKKS